MPLPTAEQTSQLSLRAMVAYGSRAACRVVRARPVRYREVCEKALSAVNTFVTSPFAGDAVREAALAAAEIVGELDAPWMDHRVAFSVLAAVNCCGNADLAWLSAPPIQTSALRRAARAAVRAASQWNDPFAAQLALADYELLVKLFGKRKGIFLGEPFDPSDEGPLGPVLPYPNRDGT